MWIEKRLGSSMGNFGTILRLYGEPTGLDICDI